MGCCYRDVILFVLGGMLLSGCYSLCTGWDVVHCDFVSSDFLRLDFIHCDFACCHFPVKVFLEKTGLVWEPRSAVDVTMEIDTDRLPNILSSKTL